MNKEAQVPGTIVHSAEQWPAPFGDACCVSHPETAPPIGAGVAQDSRSVLHGIRRGERERG